MGHQCSLLNLNTNAVVDGDDLGEIIRLLLDDIGSPFPVCSFQTVKVVQGLM